MKAHLWKIGRKKLVNAKTESTGHLFQVHKAGVLFDAEFVKLVELVTDAARFGGSFLRPTAIYAQFPQSLLESV